MLTSDVIIDYGRGEAECSQELFYQSKQRHFSRLNATVHKPLLCVQSICTGNTGPVVPWIQINTNVFAVMRTPGI